jgi:hypothetical protein
VGLASTNAGTREAKPRCKEGPWWAERLAIQLQIPVPAEGGQLARRLPAPSRYASNDPAPTAPGRRQAPASRRDRRDLSAAIVGSAPPSAGGQGPEWPKDASSRRTGGGRSALQANSEERWRSHL